MNISAVNSPPLSHFITYGVNSRQRIFRHRSTSKAVLFITGKHHPYFEPASTQHNKYLNSELLNDVP
jgi:hypothetical protein